MLKWSTEISEDLVLAITKKGQRREYPSAISGSQLTGPEREELRKHGWLHHKGHFWHPDAKRSGLWDKIQHPERYYPEKYPGTPAVAHEADEAD